MENITLCCVVTGRFLRTHSEMMLLVRMETSNSIYTHTHTHTHTHTLKQNFNETILILSYGYL